MLKRISLKNYLTIKNLEVSFEEGLNILTGETGTGKSLVLGAIEVFTQKRFPKELKKIDSEDLEIEINIQDGKKNILLKRVVDKKYQSIFYIDELKVKFEKISEIFDEFFLFFGQKSASKLLLQKNHINYFDQYIMISDSLISLNNLYTVYDSVKKDLDKQKKLLKELEEKEEFYRFKLKELNKLEIESDEQELEILAKLKKNNSLKKNNEDISEVVSKIDNLLLKEIYQLSRKIGKIDAISFLDEKISDASTYLEEVSYELSKLLNTFENFDEDFDALEDKIYVSKELKRKYGLTLDKLIEERTLIQSALDNSSNLEDEIISLEKKLKLAYDQLYAESLNLSEKRKKFSGSFSLKIQKHLKDMGIKNCSWVVSFREKDISSDGIDDLEFLFSSTIELPPDSLNKVASGGEASRILLALSLELSKSFNSKVVIFDEPDVGLGGAIAEKLGQKIFNLSSNVQVICISHLPQVASFAKNHLLVEKTLNKEQSISINSLSRSGRIDEIARMLSGEVLEEEAYSLAKKMIK
ncbi:MAG: AAA family ATPase [Candidatus Dadabacteria bacterium]|nr:AAA family ATPase [Candidatus Dadabacteria bacterium]